VSADKGGAFLHAGAGAAVSVWAFVEGRSGADVPLDGQQMEGAGVLLGVPAPAAGVVAWSRCSHGR
jgi:hypothetical protein